MRLGILKTSHGDVETPAFVPVGTQAAVKALSPQDLDSFLGIQLFFVNTYHVYLRPGSETIVQAGGIHKFMSWNKSVITDSGGFQVFSLGRKKFVNIALSEMAVLDRERFTNKLSLVQLRKLHVYPDEYRPVGELVAIDEDGVSFTSHLDGSRHRFTPEISVSLQHQLGSDIIIAFDECAPYPCTREYAQASLKRTNNWLLRSINTHKKLNLQTAVSEKKMFYGVIQGSIYPDLRKESRDFVCRVKDVDGIAIGGVSVGESKKEMAEAVIASTTGLPEGLPRHLLGVGQIDDIFLALENGIDTFDCVVPTRLARVGELLIHPHSLLKAESIFPVVKKWTINIGNQNYARAFQAVDPHCGCYTCRNYQAAYLNHLFRTKELLFYRLASLHNLAVMQAFVKEIVNQVKKGSYQKFRQAVMKRARMS